MSLGDDGPERSPTAALRALAHPVRLRILSLLTSAAMTAAEVARELELTHANASYHLRHLLAAGMIEVAGEERIRGGVAKRYRYDIDRHQSRRADAPWATEPGGQRLVYAALAAELRRRSDLLQPSRRGQLTDAELWIDPDVYTALRDRLSGLARDLHRAARPVRAEGAIRVSATIALFEMADRE